MARTQVFERRSRIDAPASEVFAWHLRDGAFERLQPPGDGTRVLRRTGSIEDDTMRVTLSVPILGPVRQRWEVRHEGFRAGERFVDVLERGPFRSWRHEHRVEAIDDAACELVDHVEYELPGWAPGRLVGGPMVRARLRSMFDHRHAITRDDLAAHGPSGLDPIKVELAGLWTDEQLQLQVAAFLATGGHDVASPRPLAGSSMPTVHETPDVSVTQVSDLGLHVRSSGGETRTVDVVGDLAIDPRRLLSAITLLRARA